MTKVPPDPVLSAFDLPLHRVLYPFGFPLELRTNSADVIAAAVQGWGAFEQMFDEMPVQVSLGVTDMESEPLPLESVIRSREHMMTVIADPHNFVVCDFERGFAFGWVTRSTAADYPLVRYRFLMAAGATLVQQRAFAPIHGALVARNGVGIILAGDSFAGKSTLAYACARAGWTYISDDAACLARNGTGRFAVGDPYSIRFRLDAPELFPELAHRLATVRPNGKLAIEVLTRDLCLKTAQACEIGHVVALKRQPAIKIELRLACKEAVRSHLTTHAVLGTQDMRDAQSAAYERLLDAQLWEMHYSDLDDAVTRLDRLVDTGA